MSMDASACSTFRTVLSAASSGNFPRRRNGKQSGCASSSEAFSATPLQGTLCGILSVWVTWSFREFP